MESLVSCRTRSTFFSDVTKLIDKLEPQKSFLIEIEQSGGSICLMLDLPGDTNIGSVLSWRDMARLSALRIDLGVEVFSDFNYQPSAGDRSVFRGTPACDSLI